MTYDYAALQAKAQKLYDTALETELENSYGIVKVGGMFEWSGGVEGWVDSVIVHHVLPFMPEHTQAELERLVNETSAKFADVPNIFADWWDLPDPTSFADPVSQCEEAMYFVSAEKYDDPIGNSSVPGTDTEYARSLLPAGRDLTEWDGLAAKAFVDNVVLPFSGRMSNMYTAIAALRAAYKAEQAVWQEIPTRLNDMADKAQAAIENCYECSPDDWGIVVDVCSVLAAVPVPVVNVIGTLGASAASRKAQQEGQDGAESAQKKADIVPKACSVVNATVDLVGKGEKLASDADKDQHTKADNPAEVIASLTKSLKQLNSNIATAESHIANGMKHALGMLGTYKGDFVPGPPALPDATGNQDLLGSPNQSGQYLPSWA